MLERAQVEVQRVERLGAAAREHPAARSERGHVRRGEPALDDAVELGDERADQILDEIDAPRFERRPGVLLEPMEAEDEAIAAADTLLLTVPNQLGVDYNAHVIDAVLQHLAPELGWR